MTDVFICHPKRSAIGRFGGTLSSVRPDDLAAQVFKAVLEQAPELDPSAIDEVIMGCANQAGEDNRNVARMSALLAGLPAETLQALMAIRPREAYTRYTLVEDEALLQAIAQVRSQGWALINQELEEGLISVAAPLLNAQGQVVAAINVSGQANRTNAQEMQARIVPPLLRTAQGVSQLLRTARR